jgi:hypothetical protein
VGDDAEAGGEALLGLAAKLLHLVVGEAGQDRIALGHLEGAAAGDLDGVPEGLGQVGEERLHLALRLEVVLGGEAAAGLLLVHVGAFRDAEERVVGLEERFVGEVDVVGGDQRQVEGVGELDGRGAR